MQSTPKYAWQLWVLGVGVLLVNGCTANKGNASSEPPIETSKAVEAKPLEASATKAGPRGKLDAPLLSGLGDFHFELDTTEPLAQRFFDQGLVMHFGFNHAEAVRSFRQASKLDPSCALCFAGIALSLGPNYNAQMNASDAEDAFRAARNALQLSASANAHERAYVEAIAARYPEASVEGRKIWDMDYAGAMEKVSRAYPRDATAAALYAEAMMVAHPWDLWTRDNEPKAWTPAILRTLEAGLKIDPEHPLLNHLYIHAVEAGPEPEKALVCARRLEKLVPGAGHLVHMPAHVYIRTGDYHAASLANERAIQSDKDYLEQVEAQGAYPLAYAPHNYHFLWATMTLEGRRKGALDAARGLEEHTDREMMLRPGFGTLQHFISVPYYALVAFGLYDDVLDLEEPTGMPLYPQAVWHYARGMAFAAQGRVPEARAELRFVSAAATNTKLDDVTIWDINSTRTLMQIAEALLHSEISAAQRDLPRALEHAARAVALEDCLNYDEPPPWGPATRRYYGALLLESGNAEAAETTYREDLAEFPRNGWSLFGLMQSLRAQKKNEEARDIEEQFKEAWKHTDVVLTRSRL